MRLVFLLFYELEEGEKEDLIFALLDPIIVSLLTELPFISLSLCLNLYVVSATWMDRRSCSKVRDYYDVIKVKLKRFGPRRGTKLQNSGNIYLLQNKK